MKRYPPDIPCDHPGCLSHKSHPCEGCGRIKGMYTMFWVSPAHEDVDIKIGGQGTKSIRAGDSLVLEDIKAVLDTLEVELDSAVCGDVPDIWMVRLKMMTQDEIEDMPEWDGW